MVSLFELLHLRVCFGPWHTQEVPIGPGSLRGFSKWRVKTLVLITVFNSSQ